MLGIHRINLACGVFEKAADVVAGNYEGLLVGQGDVFAGFYGAHGRLQTTVADRGGKHHVGIVGLGCIGKSRRAGSRSDTEWGKGVAEMAVFAFVGDDGQTGTKPLRQPDKAVDVRSCREDSGLKKFGMPSDDVKALAAYRSCGSEDGNIFLFCHNFLLLHA